ncbi:MAG: hypothetical protein AAGM38_13405 [Pseudomonadota bacterium]
MTPRRTLLVDGDDIAWRAALAAGRGGVGSESLEPYLAAEIAMRLEAAQSRLGAHEIVIALTDAENWRRGLWPGYKAHRAGRPRPPALAPARRLLRTRWRARQAPGLEADDLLGLMATGASLAFGALGHDVKEDAKEGAEGDAQSGAPEPRLAAALRRERTPPPPRQDARDLARGASDGAQRVVLSPDKDMRTTPCLLARPDGSVRAVSPDEADDQHAFLTLAGDASDGYPGCPGLGAVKARRLLDAAMIEAAERDARGGRPAFAHGVPHASPARWRAVAEAYRAAGRPLSEALAQARIARVLRCGELTADGRPRLFDPPW